MKMMKKCVILLGAIFMIVPAFAQSNDSSAVAGLKEYAGKKVVVISTGKNFDYDEDKRVLRGNQDQVAQSQSVDDGRSISKLFKNYGADVLEPFSNAYQEIKRSVESFRDGDYSQVAKLAASLDVDYVFMVDLSLMTFRTDQLHIYEFVRTVLNVRENTIDRALFYSSLNAVRDKNVNAAQARVSKENTDGMCEMVQRNVPRLYAVSAVEKGNKVALLPDTCYGQFDNDQFYVYNMGAVSVEFNGMPCSLLTLEPLAQSKEHKMENGILKASLNKKIEYQPTLICSGGSLITSDIPGFDYPSVPISVIVLDDANSNSYENHNKLLTNFALLNAIHKNKMLKVVADAQQAAMPPMFECKLSEYTESKNIVNVKLTITEIASKNIVKDVAVQAHTSNLANVIASYVNAVFCSPVILGSVDKKTISYYVPYPIAYKEGEKFLLSLDGENRTPVMIYTLVSWKGQEYILEGAKTVDKKAAGMIGKDPEARYVLTRYVDPVKDPKKDNSEIRKVADANKMYDLLGM